MTNGNITVLLSSILLCIQVQTIANMEWKWSQTVMENVTVVKSTSNNINKNVY